MKSSSHIVLAIGCLLFMPALLAEDADAEGKEKDSEISEVQTPQPAPQSRMEKHRQMREAKKEQVETPKQAIWEKYLFNFDQKGNNSFEDLNFWGFHPRLDWIARGSGAAGGVRYWRPEAIGPVDVMGSAYYSWRRYQHYDLHLGLIPNRGKKIPSTSFETDEIEQLGDVDQGKFSHFKLYGTARYRDRTDESFYGLGPDTTNENRLRYRVKDTLAEAVTGYQFNQRVGFTFKTGYIKYSLACGRSDPDLCDNIPERAPPGIFEPPSYFRLHGSFLLDYRDNPGVPRKGFMAAFGWQKWDDLETLNRHNFQRFALDTRGYIPLGSRQRVVALRGVFVNSDPSDGSRVPFFLQPSLGGGESLRGFADFRFQGDKMMLLQAEYRWEASRRFELAFFGDTGSVALQGQRISLDKLKSDFGIGLRVKSSRSTLFRIDTARSNEGYRVHFRFSASF